MAEGRIVRFTRRDNPRSLEQLLIAEDGTLRLARDPTTIIKDFKFLIAPVTSSGNPDEESFINSVVNHNYPDGANAFLLGSDRSTSFLATSSILYLQIQEPNTPYTSSY